MWMDFGQLEEFRRSNFASEVRRGAGINRRDSACPRIRNSGTRSRGNKRGPRNQNVLATFSTVVEYRVALLARNCGQFRRLARSRIILPCDQQGSEFLHPIRLDHWLAGASQDDGRIDTQHPERIDHAILEVPQITRGMGDQLLEVTLRISIIKIDGGVNQPILERG